LTKTDISGLMFIVFAACWLVR